MRENDGRKRGYRERKLGKGRPASRRRGMKKIRIIKLNKKERKKQKDALENFLRAKKENEKCTRLDIKFKSK